VSFEIQVGAYSPSLIGESITLVQFGSGPSFRATTATDLQFDSGQWNHVAVSWNAGESRYDLYWNGVSQKVATNGNGHVQRVAYETMRLASVDGNRKDAYSGYLDELVVWDGTVPAEVLTESSTRPTQSLPNVAPIARPIRTTTISSASVGILLEGFDGDSDTFSFTTDSPNHGTLVWDAEGSALTYTPERDFVGTDRFTAQIHDRETSGSQFTVEVSVESPKTPQLSYYAPGQGTINIGREAPGIATQIGEEFPAEIIVNSQYSRLIERFSRSGETLWRYRQPYEYHSVDYYRGEVFYTALDEIHVLDGQTGTLTRRIALPDDTSYVLFANVTDDDAILIGRQRKDGSFSIDRVSHQGQLQQSWFQGQVSSPRWADISGDQLAIADTFQHRVILLNLDDSTSKEIPVYYPNDLRFDGQRLLITEEHADRVVWYDLDSGERTVLLSGPGQRNDLSSTIIELRDLSNAESSRIDPNDVNSKSISSTDYSQSQTLYSPNGAVPYESGVIIADTDNHRVVFVDANGQVLSTLSSFNTPTRVAIVDD
jgi:hypothetical protein